MLVPQLAAFAEGPHVRSLVAANQIAGSPTLGRPVFAPPQQGGATWSVFKIGAGGMTTGTDTVSDGTLVTKTDTYGAYIYNRSAPNPGNAGGLGVWEQLCTRSRITGVSLTADPELFSDGVTEIRIAPKALESNIIYMAWIGYIWFSTNRGLTLAKTAYPYDSSGAAGYYWGNGLPFQVRSYNYKMAVDPANSDCGIFVNPIGKPPMETIGGTTGGAWSALSGVASVDGSQTGLVAFDPSSNTTGGRTNICYVAISGAGLYKRSTPTGAWSLVPGIPSGYIVSLRCAGDGTVYCVMNGLTLWKLVGSTWTNITPPPIAGRGVYHVSTLNVAPYRTIMAWTDGPGGAFSTDAGVNWTSSSGQNYNPANQVATDAPWYGSGKGLYLHGWMSMGTYPDPTYDALDNNKLWVTCNQGLWQISLPTPANESANPPLTETTFVSGLEQVCAQHIHAPLGYGPIVVGQDIGIIRCADVTKYPPIHSWPQNYFLSQGSTIDSAPGVPGFVVAKCNGQDSPEVSCYSLDGGATWTAFATPLPNVYQGGDIGCYDDQRIMAVNTHNAAGPYYSGNRGGSWSIPVGVPQSGWHGQMYFRRRGIAADKSLTYPGRFYLTYPFGGIYVIDNGVLVAHYANTIDRGAHTQLLSMPTVAGGTSTAGHLLYIEGNSTPGPYPRNVVGIVPYYSFDGGQTFNDISNLSAVGGVNQWTLRDLWAIGYGKEAPGANYVTWFVYGWVVPGPNVAPQGSSAGFWKSTDRGKTWQQIGDAWPDGWLDKYVTLSGDINIHGRLYVGCSGSGWRMYG